MDEIEKTVAAIHREGRANINSMVKRRTGKLSRFYTKGVSRAKGKGAVGYRTKKAKKEAFYARFVHDGTADNAAKPFHDNAVESEEANHQHRMKSIVRKIGGAGAPGLLGRTGGR